MIMTSVNAIKVLDHGYVRLVETWGHGDAGALTVRPITQHDPPDDYECGIIEAARQSTQASFRGWDEDSKLLAYLHNNKHSTPFEFAGMVVEVQAPIFVFREWHRHRTQCLAGDTPLVFERPCDGKAYRLKIADVVRKWSSPRARVGIMGMTLRGDTGTVQITDAWHSGRKRVYRVVTKYGSVVASADHVFKTPDGGRTLRHEFDCVMGLVSVGADRDRPPPEFTESEVSQEEWRSWGVEGYEVSGLGRVRSFRTTRGFRAEPRFLQIVTNKSDRAVVNIAGRAVQVSHLVATAFMGWDGSGWVLHDDDNPRNNRASNLKIGDGLQNMQDQYTNGGRRRLREMPIKVERVELVGEQDVFDISVTGDHWFAADNLIVHNSYNEMSARYAPLPNLNYMPTVERILMDGGRNKQAGGVKDSVPVNHRTAQTFQNNLLEVYSRCQTEYQAALRSGVPKELARILLPVGRYSRMRASANLRNWLAFVTLRSDPAAQWEIRQYSDTVGQILARQFPKTWELFRSERSK